MSKSPDLAETVQCLCLASRKAARAITRAFDKELRKHGVRSTQFSVLAILELKGERPIGDLAAMIGADRTTLSRNLALVEEQGLVRMRAGDDARARIVAITVKGRHALNRALPAWKQVQSALTASIGTSTAENLRRLARAARF